MRPIFRPLAIAFAACLLLFGGCRDKHAPVKPTVFSAAAFPTV